MHADTKVYYCEVKALGRERVLYWYKGEGKEMGNTIRRSVCMSMLLYVNLKNDPYITSRFFNCMQKAVRLRWDVGLKNQKYTNGLQFRNIFTSTRVKESVKMECYTTHI